MTGHVPAESALYRRALLAAGIPAKTIEAWSVDPLVQFEG
eukprot:COSAG02_NODE_25709_length_651_cov_1.039855_2_plen_39_part_01